MTVLQNMNKIGNPVLSHLAGTLHTSQHLISWAMQHSMCIQDMSGCLSALCFLNLVVLIANLSLHSRFRKIHYWHRVTGYLFLPLQNYISLKGVMSLSYGSPWVMVKNTHTHKAAPAITWQKRWGLPTFNFDVQLGAEHCHPANGTQGTSLKSRI